MGVQKTGRSRSRTNKKRSEWLKLDGVQATTCPNCHEPRLPHRVCPSCGYYNGRKVGAVNTAPTAENN